MNNSFVQVSSEKLNIHSHRRWLKTSANNSKSWTIHQIQYLKGKLLPTYRSPIDSASYKSTIDSYGKPTILTNYLWCKKSFPRSVNRIAANLLVSKEALSEIIWFNESKLDLNRNKKHYLASITNRVGSIMVRETVFS